MSQNDDSLKIPIEIKTEDLDEIRELINEISQAESDLHSLKATPRKGRGSGDQSSRSAFASPQSDERGGIFGSEGGTMPKGFDSKDDTSKSPFQRESEFAKLQQQVQEQTQSQGSATTLQGGIGAITQGLGLTSTFSGGGVRALEGLGKMASKTFLPLALITTVAGIAQGVLDAMLKPGGRLDRRFRRDYKKESQNLMSLAEKQEISFGRRTVRVTTISSQRGTNSQVRSNLDYVKRGIDVFDVNGTFNKNIGAGTI